MADIPIVDFAKAASGTPNEKTHIASQIDEAFRTVGFVYLKNHGVPREKVEECFDWSKKFFALPASTKLLAPHPPGGSHHRGYSAPGVEKVSQHEYDAAELNKLREAPDFKESYESGNVNDAAQPNIWLPEYSLPGFRVFMELYFDLCKTLIHQLLDTLSIALNVPEPDELTHQKRSRINAHSDFGTLTLLFQDSVGGLEIEDPNHPGAFRPASPIPDTVLVNVGDLMARWSNDRWKSTVHRVGIPQGMKGDVVPDRYSIPFFATADPQTVIEALPGCYGEGREKRYESVTAEGYVQMRMAALYEA